MGTNLYMQRYNIRSHVTRAPPPFMPISDNFKFKLVPTLSQIIQT